MKTDVKELNYSRSCSRIAAACCLAVPRFHPDGITMNQKVAGSSPATRTTETKRPERFFPLWPLLVSAMRVVAPIYFG